MRCEATLGICAQMSEKGGYHVQRMRLPLLWRDLRSNHALHLHSRLRQLNRKQSAVH